MHPVIQTVATGGFSFKMSKTQEQKMKKTYSPKLKLKIALEALKNDKTISQICQEYSVANSQVYKWKKQLLDEGSSIFENAVVALSLIHI